MLFPVIHSEQPFQAYWPLTRTGTRQNGFRNGGGGLPIASTFILKTKGKRENLCSKKLSVALCNVCNNKDGNVIFSSVFPSLTDLSNNRIFVRISVIYGLFE